MTLRFFGNFWAVVLGVFVFLGSQGYAFDVINRQLSYMDSKYTTFGLGLGFGGLIRSSGVSSGTGFGFRTTLGHHFNRYVHAEFVYQFTTFKLTSPDPVDSAVDLKTRTAMNEEILRLIFLYPAVVAQPFFSVGVGSYHWTGLNKETGLSLPIQLEIPLAIGFQSYIYRNAISLDVEFGYQFLLGEDQSTETKALLHVDKVSFDSYSMMTSFTFHFF